jgi:hypothetical protein
MISRFFSQSGSPKDAIDYLLDEKKEPTLMRGNSANFELLASELPFKNKYTSGVLRFNEKPDEATLDEIMNEYSNFLTAGLNQPPEVLWVMHQEHGETELHFVLPNVDLESKRFFQPYLHKRDLACRDALDNAINAKFGFTDPDDPANKRLTNSASNYLKISKDRKKLAQNIDDFVMQQAKEAIANGFKYTNKNAISDIKDVLGFDIKTSRGKLSITHSDMKKPMRLKGAFYEPNFSFSASSVKENSTDSERYRTNSGKRLAENESEYSKLIERRANAVRAKYSDSWKRTRTRNQEREQTQQATNKNNLATSNRNINGAGSYVVSVDDMDKEQKHGTLSTTTGVSRGESDPDNQRWVHFHQEHRLQLSRQQGPNRNLQIAIIPCFYLNKEIGRILDNGIKLTAQDFKSDKSAAFNIVMEGKKKGWKAMKFTGNEEFLKSAFEYALKNNIEINVTSTLQARILEKVREDDRIRKNAFKSITGDKGGAEDFKRRVQNDSQKSADFRRKINSIDKAIGVREMNRDDELNKFKSDINLVAYAKEQGFEISHNDSTNKSVKMKNGQQTIIISTDKDGHGIFFDVKSRKSGSIIDFVQGLKKLNLGQVRKELRPWIGRDSLVRRESDKYAKKPKAPSNDGIKVNDLWNKAKKVDVHPYLLARGISKETQQHPKFTDKIRIDTRGNAVFPHIRNGEVVGFETKNNGWTGFSPGGEKALWYSNDLMHSDTIVIVESAIDALSFHQIHHEFGRNYGYISTGGKPNEKQLISIRNLAEKQAVKNFEICIATDNDRGGVEICDEILSAVANVAIKELISIKKPKNKDWNEDLVEFNIENSKKTYEPSPF